MKKTFSFLLILLILFYFTGWIYSRLVYPVSYRDLIVRTSSEYNLDPLFIGSVIFAESRYNEKAVSSAGAKGLMQLMPLTALEISKELKMAGYSEEILFEKEPNIKIGCYHFAKLKKKLEGEDRHWVLAAYNAGIANVLTWRKEALPEQPVVEKIGFPETRKYVQKIEFLYQSLKVCQKLGMIGKNKPLSEKL